MTLPVFVLQRRGVDRVRTITKIELIEEGDELMFRFVGDGFLYNMVRILVGTLLEVGRGLRSPDDIPQMIEAKRTTVCW